MSRRLGTYTSVESLLTLASSERGLDRHEPLDLAAITSLATGRRRVPVADREQR